MVAEAVNASVSVMRASTTNEFGQPTGLTAAYTAVPVVLIDTLKASADGTNMSPTAVRTVECHVSTHVHVLASDQFVDERTGVTYLVRDVTQPPTLIGAPVDTLVTLQRVET